MFILIYNMRNKSDICCKLLCAHIKTIPKLYKSFNFSYHTQKYKLTDILNDVIYVMKTGISYRNLRSNIKWTTVYKAFRKLERYKVFQYSYKELFSKYLRRGGISKKLRYISTDTTFIMNKNGKSKIGLNKYYYKKKGNKVSIIVDSNGRIIDMKIFKGGKNDGKILEEHLKNGTIIDNHHYDDIKKYFLCDAGYDAKEIHIKLKQMGYMPIIAQNKRGIRNKQLIRRMSKKDRKIYHKRMKVENVINRLKQMRRINQRYDGLVSTYESYVYLGMTYILL